MDVVVVPLKLAARRFAKFDVKLRLASLRAVHAMHTILTRMVLFECRFCRERFPAFHPAFEPPEQVGSQMEILRRRACGLAGCNIEVARWDDVPPAPGAAEEELLVASWHTGMCRACWVDIEKQKNDPEGDGSVVPKLSYLNYMDPLFRFPREDLQDLFDSMTVVEEMIKKMIMLEWRQAWELQVLVLQIQEEMETMLVV